MGARFPAYLLLLTARIDGADRVVHIYARHRAHAQNTHTRYVLLLSLVGTPANV
jgi:hypothetical protein